MTAGKHSMKNWHSDGCSLLCLTLLPKYFRSRKIQHPTLHGSTLWADSLFRYYAHWRVQLFLFTVTLTRSCTEGKPDDGWSIMVIYMNTSLAKCCWLRFMKRNCHNKAFCLGNGSITDGEPAAGNRNAPYRCCWNQSIVYARRHYSTRTMHHR